MRAFGRTSSLLLAGACLQICVGIAGAQQSGVLGFWKEPGGSIVQVATCGKDICVNIASISPTAPGRVDNNNPDTSLRGRSLCGVRIGEGFQPVSPTRAEEGRLYDPKSGRTYRGRMESHGDELSLRGYIGISILGKTERWSRTPETNVCVR